jgi:aspartyl-tRNA(Asn)/glutamyl-tRNA(Gln) amidotransferase subunit C
MAMPKTGFSPQVVQHIAQLANVVVSADEEAALATAFEETIAVVAKMTELDTSMVQPTHQVTGLENVLRSDEVAMPRMFTQAEALANANETHAGFFVVPQVIDQKDA